MFRIRNILLLTGLLLPVLLPVLPGADWGTDAGSVIGIGSGDTTLTVPGSGCLMYDGHWAAAPERTTVVDSVYNLSEPPALPDTVVYGGNVIYLPHMVQNRGNTSGDIGLELSVLGSSVFTPGLALYTDADMSGGYTAGDTPLGTGGGAVVNLEEDSSASVLLELTVPAESLVSELDSALVVFTVRGNNNTGTDDSWPVMLLKKLGIVDNTDLQADTLRLTVGYGGITGFTVLPADTQVTADDSVVFTVSARDSTGADRDVTPISTFFSTDSVRGQFINNVYYPGTADTHAVFVMYQGLVETVRVTVDPGVPVSVSLAQDTARISVATLTPFPYTALDADSNVTDAAFAWALDDPGMGTFADNVFKALRAGTTWAHISWNTVSASVFLDVADDLPPNNWISVADSVIHSSLVRVSMSAQDTAGGHVGTGADALVYLYNLDSRGWLTADTNEIILYPLSDGEHQIQVAARDEYGNVDTLTPATALFRVKLGPYEMQAKRWQMVSIPKDVQGRTIYDITEGDSGVTPYLYRWDESAEFDWIALQNVEVSSRPLELGAGYWLSGSADMRVELDSATQFKQGLDTIDLKAGWNQIGNSYSYPVNWRGSRVKATGYSLLTMGQAIGGGLVENALYGYTWEQDTVGYTLMSYSRDAKGMEPWRGYWIKANQACQLIPDSIPYFEPAAGALKKQASFTVDNWEMRFKVRSGRARDDYNFIGVAPGASVGRDIHDVSEPPQMSPYVSLYMEDGEERLASDFRPGLGEVSEWYFAVSTDVEHDWVRLSWENTDRIPGIVYLYLYDLKTGKMTDLRRTGSYKYISRSNGSRRYFRVVATRSLHYVPDRLPEDLRVLAAEPNPFTLETRVRFAVPPENSRYSDVVLAICDVKGAVVKTLVNGQLPAGTYTRMWDGTDSNGRPVPNGFYFVRLTTPTARSVGTVEYLRK